MLSHALLVAFSLVGAAAPNTLTLELGRPGVAVSPTLYGIFFEEINHAGDGGIYAELLRNRGFEQGTNGQGAPGWRAITGTAVLDSSASLNEARKRSLKITGIVANDGYWGVPTKIGERLKLRVWAKGSGTLKATVGGGTAQIGPLDGTWREHTVTLKPDRTGHQGKLEIESDGTAWIGFSSLMPVRTSGKAPLRVDLADKIKAIKPAFVRFPGGCFVEGQDFERAWDWSKSIGPVEQRPGKDWRFWGYSSTDGLGYHEYLQWCEDMGAAGLFVANCGMTHGPVAPMEEMGKFVQSALDAIEYAIGGTDTPYGAQRALNGHPAPFPLKYLQIGNENGGLLYQERYNLIARAVKAKYPQIKLVACVWFDVPKVDHLEIVDEHYYSNPSFFWSNAAKYDTYDRSGPKVYVGEYAVTQGCGEGNLAAALSEAAFMTGMERNSDHVVMASYAPLFANANRKQWNPNAVVFDNAKSYGTPSYWVQRLFGQNRADRIVPLTHNVAAAPFVFSGSVGLQTWKTQAEFRNVVLEVGGIKQILTDWKHGAGVWSTQNGVLKQTDLGQDRRTVATGPKLGQRFAYELEARKISGDEGFIVMMGVGGGRSVQWNLGGWGNTQHAFQVDGGGPQAGKPGSIETGVWYRIRLEVDGSKVVASLNGVRQQEINVPSVPDFAAVAGTSGKDLVLKMVNGSAQARTFSLNLVGGSIDGSGEGWTMSGPSLDSENSLTQPEAIAPVPTKFRLGQDGTLSVPATSVVVARFRRR